MDLARKELAAYGRSIAALLTAIESELDPMQLMAVSDATALAFNGVVRVMIHCPESERESYAAALAEMRRFSALAEDAAFRAHLKVSERLRELARAEQALAQLGQHASGESCDVAG